MKISSLFFLVLLSLIPLSSCGSSSQVDANAAPQENGPSAGNPSSGGNNGNSPVGPSGPVTYSGDFPASTGSALSAHLNVAGISRDLSISRPNTQANLPLFIVFHGTSGNGAEFLGQVNDPALGGANGAILVAPDARSMSAEDWDHGSPDVFWDTTDQDSNSNPDLMLVRAIIQEAQARYAIDPHRVYVAGYSNGGFFTILAAMALRDLVAGFAADASGLVLCDHTLDCGFKKTPLGGGSGTTSCEALNWQAQCSCNGSPKPTKLLTAGRKVPGYISHSDDDDMVSVYYSCALAAQLDALSYPKQVRILHRAGGHIVGDFLLDAWNSFLNHQSL